jgi:DNA-binding beta-propeller fold protein YncE
MFLRGVCRASVCVFVLSAFVAVSVAGATVGHRYSAQFGNGQFAGPGGVAIDQSTGDVFVADSFAGVLDEFSAGGDFVRLWDGSATPAGNFSFPTQVATDGTTVYVDNTFNNTVERYDTAGVFQGEIDASGTPAAGFSQPSGVAVDPVNGDVYVANTANNVVDRFDSSGVFVEEFGAGELASPTQLGVDSSHDVYVVDSGNGRVVEYSGGVLGATIDSSGPGAVAVDSATDDVFVADSGPSGAQITEFASDGSLVSSFGAGHVVAAAGLAVNAASNRVYVADQGIAAVQTFNAVTLPTVTTTPGASAIEAAEATIAGTVNPEGVAGTTTSHFDWGLDTNYGNSTESVDTGGGSADVPASATLTGLSPGTTYHFRVVGTNAQGSSAGADQSFTTSAAQVAVDLQPPVASAITTSGATLNDAVNPNGADTTYRYEYGTTTSYGSTTPDGDAGSVTGETSVPVAIAGLQAGTTYHFRIVAENGVGAPVQGADASFTTAPGTPSTATNVTSTSATLNATVILGATGSSYHFEYGPTTAYGVSTPETVLIAGTEEVPVSVAALALTTGTEYHFRVVATTNGQTVTGDDATFTTIPVAAVTTAAVTEVTPTTATLSASIDTHGNAGSVSFAVTSPDSAYAVTTPAVALAATSGPQSVSVALTGVPAGAEYIVTAFATVAGTTAFGEPVVFSTPALAPLAPPAPPPSISATPYGCMAPHINPVNTHPRAGDTVTVTGSDLGVGGTIALGSTQVQPTSWSAGTIAFQIPEGVSGTQPLTVNCGTTSNTVGVAIVQAPSNAFTIAKVSVKGSTATLSITVPGPGKLRASAANSTSASKTVSRASTVKLTVHLSKAGKKALARAHGKKLTVALRVTFTPTGGAPASKKPNITFKHGGTR